MQYSSVMKQLKQYRLNTVFNVSIDFLEYGYYYHHCDWFPCISIDNIEATPHELLGLIRIDNAVTKYIFFLIFGVCGMRRTATTIAIAFADAGAATTVTIAIAFADDGAIATTTATTTANACAGEQHVPTGVQCDGLARQGS